MHTHVYIYAHCGICVEVIGQLVRVTSLSTLWAPGIELRSPGLVANALTLSQPTSPQGIKSFHLKIFFSSPRVVFIDVSIEFLCNLALQSFSFSLCGSKLNY